MQTHPISIHLYMCGAKSKATQCTQRARQVGLLEFIHTNDYYEQRKNVKHVREEQSTERECRQVY